jgi:hypothetical protein
MRWTDDTIILEDGIEIDIDEFEEIINEKRRSRTKKSYSFFIYN